MRILFLSRWFPYPPNNGSKLRIYNLLRGLATKHKVTLISFFDEQDTDRRASALHSICDEVYMVPWKPFDPHSRRARLGFLSSMPRSVVDTFSPKMKRSIESVVSSNEYDLVVASQIDMAVYGRYFQGLPALFEEVEIGILYEQFVQATSLVHRFRYGLTWAKQRRYLTSLLENFEACTVVSNQERNLLSKVINGKRLIEVIPNCVDLTIYSGIRETPQPNTLIFIGAFSYTPNYEAMVWFLNKVYPQIQVQAPDVHLTITGNHDNRPLPAVTNVTLTGFVDDIRPLVSRSWCSIVPMHTGGGTRLKILEAMALGSPVIATSKGAEGIDVIPGKHILIADTPEIFAQEVVRLLKNPNLRQQLTTYARQLVNEKYNWAVVMPDFLNLVKRLSRLR